MSTGTSTMSTATYALFDADNHFYETPDCFSRHIEKQHAHLAIPASRQADGEWRVRVGDKPYDFMDVKFDRTNKPGSMLETLRSKDVNAAVKWSDSYSAENMLPAFQQRAPRLALMDEQNIERTIILPTFAVSVEHTMADNTVQTYANLRSFNRWLEETWGYGGGTGDAGRIIAPPLLSLLDRDEAIAELDRVLALGARCVHLRPGPTGSGKSPADPWYDAFWARLNEAQIPLAFHISDSRFAEVSLAWGEHPDPPVRQMSAFQWAFVHGDRPIMETLGNLIYGNLFGRFPNLRVLSLENGSDWVPYLLTVLDKKKGMGRYGPWVGGRFSGRPSEIFRRHCFVSPYPEDDSVALVERIGASQVLFGSDYPHPEGMSEPGRFAEHLEGRTDADVRLVMRDNADALFPQ